jgi:hypothetical protein
LEEFWAEDTRLPSLDSIDKIVRPYKAGEGPEEYQKTPYRPNVTPELSTDLIHAGFISNPAAKSFATANHGVAVPSYIKTHKASPSPAPSPVTASSVASPMPAIASASLPSGAATPSSNAYFPNHTAPAPSSAPLPTAALQSLEIPVNIPLSITSRDAKRRLQVLQAEAFNTRARQLLPKKRKRYADEQQDPSTGWLEPRNDPAIQRQVYHEIINRLRAEKDPR